MNRSAVPLSSAQLLTRALAAVASLMAATALTMTVGACSPLADSSGSRSPASAHDSTAPSNSARSYPRHTGIVATTFWVGEVFDPALPDGSQVCSTYDAEWGFHFSGVDSGQVPEGAVGCAGATKGGCDGVMADAGASCETEVRREENKYFSEAGPRPQENPFYVDLPYDDLNDPVGFAYRCEVIPWSEDPGYAGRCDDTSFSFMKNRWVKITGPTQNVCNGQVEDAGPSHDDLYHDADYVFGTKDARPAQTHFNNAGLDVSPALNGCLGFRELDGQDDRVDWQFVDDGDVPEGPWTIVITTSGVTR